MPKARVKTLYQEPLSGIEEKEMSYSSMKGMNTSVSDDLVLPIIRVSDIGAQMMMKGSRHPTLQGPSGSHPPPSTAEGGVASRRSGCVGIRPDEHQDQQEHECCRCWCRW